MAIAGYTPTSKQTPVKDTLTISDDHYKGVVYDDALTPLQHLIGQVSGTPWTVDYYHQHLGKDNNLREIDPGESNVFQQYSYIKGMELRITSPLSSSTSQDTSITTVTGSALVYPFTIPNVNDYFKAKTIDNQEALYQITQVERRIFNRDSVYQVEFQLVAYKLQEPGLFRSLDDKVINTLYFNKDRLMENLNPLLTTEQQQLQNKVVVDYKELVQFYFRTFFNRECAALILPGQTTRVYDHFITNYLLSIVETEDAPEVRLLRTKQNDHREGLEYYQFWDILLHRDPTLLPLANRYMGTAVTKEFNYNTWLGGMRFGLIDKIIYPSVVDTSLHSGKFRETVRVVMGDISPTLNYRDMDWFDGTMFEEVEEALEDEETEIPTEDLPELEEDVCNELFPPVTVDPCYVLTEGFYSQSPKLTLLETLVLDYLNHRSLQLNSLERLLDNVYEWNRLEQYYYLPVVLLLLKEARKERY